MKFTGVQMRQGHWDVVFFSLFLFVLGLTCFAGPPKESPPIAPQLEIVPAEAKPLIPKPVLPDLDKDWLREREKIETALWKNAIKLVTDAIEAQGKEIKEAAVEAAGKAWWAGVFVSSVFWVCVWLLTMVIIRRTPL